MNSAELCEYGECSIAVNKPKANALKAQMICPTHRRKVLFMCNYLDDGTYAHITRYCCTEHAQRVADAFIEAQLFDFVEINPQ